jgi:hypothetical protein
MRSAFILVLIVCAGAALHLVLFGQSRQVIFGDAHQVAVNESDPSVITIRFQGRFDGMRKILVSLPNAIRRRPMEPGLVDGEGHGFTLTDTGEFGRSRSRRTFWVDPPVADSRGRDFVLTIRFPDGPIPAEAGALDFLTVTIYHDLDLAQTMENYRAFKPIPSPALISLLLLVAAAAGAAVLLGSLGRTRPTPR